jgi:hypothetical protein
VSVEHFRRRADECRRLASVAGNASDKAFWLGLVERWRALEGQKAQQPVRDRSRSPLRRQTELGPGTAIIEEDGVTAVVGQGRAVVDATSAER